MSLISTLIISIDYFTIKSRLWLRKLRHFSIIVLLIYFLTTLFSRIFSYSAIKIRKNTIPFNCICSKGYWSSYTIWVNLYIESLCNLSLNYHKCTNHRSFKFYRCAARDSNLIFVYFCFAIDTFFARISFSFVLL